MTDEESLPSEGEAFKIGILTVSDSCFTGESEDKSGPNLSALVAANILPQVRQNAKLLQEVVPDEKELIKEKLIEWIDQEGCNLIFTTGGTGFSSRDVTPEATKEVITKDAPGMAHAMMSGSLQVTKMAMLSRSVCGIRDKSLVINLPGSKKAAEECFQFVLPAIPHALDLLSENLQLVRTLHQSMQAPEKETATKSNTQAMHHVCPHKKLDHDSAVTPSRLRYFEYVAERDRKSPYPMMPMDEAVPVVLTNTPFVDLPEELPTSDALGYILYEDVYATEPHPPFPASIKDGYAVIAADGEGERIVLDKVTAGTMSSKKISRGYCCRITTGAPLPDGADAVIQVEDTELLESVDQGKKEKSIKIIGNVRTGQDIRPIGYDIHIGEKLLSKGDRLGPAELGLLSSTAITSVKVQKKPTIAVLSTGDEIVNPGQSRKRGQIFDSNKTALLAAIKSEGFTAVDAGITTDKPGCLYTKLREAAKSADIVVTTGGVSMGEKDILKPVLQEKLGAKIHFGRVHMKPGKPTTFATGKIAGIEKIFFALPGNPVSALVTFYLFVLPSMRKMAGFADPNLRKMKARMGFSMSLDLRPEYHRAILQWNTEDGIPVANSTGSQCSSRLLSLRSANSLIVLPARTDDVTEVPQDSLVDVLVFGCM